MPSQSIENVSNKGFALHVRSLGYEKSFFLYDAKLLLSHIKKNVENEQHPFKNVIDECFYGMIVIRNPIGQAYGSKEVAKSAAQKGYGPLLYDIAMNDAGGLIPDRRSVSGDARKIWKKYMGRADVDHKKLDDIDEPQTPTEFDDAKTYNEVGLENEEVLNYAFFLDDYPSHDQLLKNDEIFFQECSKFMERSKIINSLALGFQILFSRKHSLFQ